MPVLLLERLPLPSLEAYAVISVSLLGWSLHYAAEKTLDPEWKMQFVGTKNNSQGLPGTLQTLLSHYWLSSRAHDIISFSLHDSLCIWVSTISSITGGHVMFTNFIIFSFKDCCKHGILPCCAFWKLASKASFWRAKSFRTSTCERQVLEFCILQIHLHIWHH